MSDTSWEKVASWYQQHVTQEDSYHQTVILPNLLRLMDIKSDSQILDLACGSGFFANEFKKKGAKVRGVDLSPELIKLAKENYSDIEFKTASAHKLPHIQDESVDVVTIILAIQNIKEVKEMLGECQRVLKPSGRIFIVMNHPMFRIPGSSGWQWDESGKQYRRIDAYMTENSVPIKMHPGHEPSSQTVSFHRPLQYYLKLTDKSGFTVKHLEEWISPKKSQSGPRQKEEDRMRKEIPLFMALELVKTF